MPSGWKPEWHCGVRAGNAGKLVAFIAAVPAKIRVYDKTVQMVEINFLCVHKKLRSKRLAPVLIREITRRVNQNGIFQATFTAGIIIPKPVGTCRLINIFLYFFSNIQVLASIAEPEKVDWIQILPPRQEHDTSPHRQALPPPWGYSMVLKQNHFLERPISAETTVEREFRGRLQFAHGLLEEFRHCPDIQFGRVWAFLYAQGGCHLLLRDWGTLS